MINITKQELEKLPTLQAQEHNNGGTLYIKDGHTLYKIFHDRYFFIDEKERNVDFLITAPLSCPKPLDKIYIDGIFYGYSEPYIQNSISFLNAIYNDSDPTLDKDAIIRDIFQQLQELHRLNVFLGDIHLDNFIFDNNSHGYIIDLDDIRFKSIDDFKFTEYYCLRNDDNSPSHKIADERTDIVKTFICALSFYYQIDFEELVKQKGLNAFFTSLDELNITHPSIDMIKSMWYENGDIIYPTSLTTNEKTKTH